MRNLASLLAGFAAGVALLFAAPTPQKKAPAATKKSVNARPGTVASRTAGKQQTATAKRYTYSRQTARSRTTATYARNRRPGASPAPVGRRSYGQVTPTQDRLVEIQQALITKGYLTASPSGVWDAASMDAMKRFQQDQNLTPTGKITSLSLIALGLGPKRDPDAVSNLTGAAPAAPAVTP